MDLSRARLTRRTPALSMALLVALAMTGPAQAATSNPDPGPLELANGALSRQAATEGMVLLENQGKGLPMAKAGNVAVFGVGAYKTVKGGTGSGEVYNRYTVSVRQGLEKAGYTVTTSNDYWSAMTSAYDKKYGASTGSFFSPAIDYSSVEQLLTDATVKPTAPTTTAIYVVARNAGEGADRAAKAGDYYLTDTEKADVKIIGQSYERVIVVLNAGGIVDTAFYKEINAAAKDPGGKSAVDSLFLMSQAGQESGSALVDVLNGTVNPSGRLTDTWASKYSYYPASSTFGNNDNNVVTENYSEGVYVGYRYFDSFFKKVNSADPASVVSYPFGYGLSYTTFKVKTQNVTANSKTVKVKVKVTNTGATSGKQVVQVYFSAPRTGVDKPYQELAAYGKTDQLAPGASQILTLSFDTTQMSSFDTAKAAYVMDPGDYVIRVGVSSRDTHVAAKVALKSAVVTEQVNNELDGASSANEMKASAANFYSYADEADEIADAARITVKAASFTTKDSRSAYEQNVTVPTTSPYYAIDKSPISTTTALIDPTKANWEGTGAKYKAKAGEKIEYIKTVPNVTLFDVAKGYVSMKRFVAGLSVEQLANIVEGANTAGTTPSAVGAAGYTTAKYEAQGIAQMVLADGPAGVRITQKVPTTPATYQWCTAWPIGTLMAQTWDRDVITKVGAAIGKEMTEYGATLWLAPGMNIHRDPLNGRNFEYYSEDPLLSGLTASASTLGVQSNKGVGVTVKHYLANNQEANRNATDSVVSERALREIYLKGFEYAVKSAQPMALMTSYNKINGTWASKNYDLNTDLLRGEWGFKGLVMTDWGGVHGATDTMYSGNDLIEPGNNPTEVMVATKKTAAVIDIDGLPAYTRTNLDLGSFKWTTYQWRVGSLVLSAVAKESIATTVNASTDLSKAPLSQTIDTNYSTGASTTTPHPKYASVDAAHKAITAMLADASALTADQKAAISVTDVVRSGSAVTSYKVTVKGTYTVDMRLGDLQRSAMRILSTVMQSAPFQQLADAKHKSGINVGSYTDQFSDLAVIADVAKGKVK